MSGERSKDYKKVIKEVKSLLPNLSVKSIMLDFEPVIWKAASSGFEDVKLLGSVFHWCQALW